MSESRGSAGGGDPPGRDRRGKGTRHQRQALTGAILRDLQIAGLSFTRSISGAGVEFASNSEVVTLISLRLDGPMRPRAIVDLTNFTRGGVTSMLDRMETSGLIRRVRGVTSDRRGVVVELTEDGIGATDRIAEAFESSVDLSAAFLERLRQWFELGGIDPGPVPSPPARSAVGWLIFVREIGHAGRAVNRVFMNIMDDDDLTPHLSYLALWLAEHEGRARPRDVSGVTGLTSGGTTELLDRLESRGLLERSYGAPHDHRAVLLTPTDEGRRRVAAVLDAAVEPLAAFGRTFFPAR